MAGIPVAPPDPPADSKVFPMMRYARDAAAVLFALLAVGFVGLWVRSYYRLDRARMPLGGYRHAGFSSYQGVIAAGYGEGPPYASVREWFFVSLPSSETHRFDDRSLFETTLGFSAGRGPSRKCHFTFPHWFLAASFLALAALFAFKRTWRYSLRTVLVATTLLAGLLGFAVYQLR